MICDNFSSQGPPGLNGLSGGTGVRGYRGRPGEIGTCMCNYKKFKKSVSENVAFFSNRHFKYQKNVHVSNTCMCNYKNQEKQCLSCFSSNVSQIIVFITKKIFDRGHAYMHTCTCIHLQYISIFKIILLVFFFL